MGLNETGGIRAGLKIFIAPNGARLKKSDHSALPVTIAEIVKTAAECHQAGATGIHAHVRDSQGRHVLDAGLYKELLTELALKVPQLEVQITTEAVGLYSPAEQRALVEAVKPKAVSVALREMLADNDEAAARRFYFRALEQDIDLQHIIYSPEEIIEIKRLTKEGLIPDSKLSLLFVLGRHSINQQSTPEMLTPFVEAMQNAGFAQKPRFMVCAFGRRETACLMAAARVGGDCRIGFENNFYNADGALARNNAERVRELTSKLVQNRSVT